LEITALIQISRFLFASLWLGCCKVPGAPCPGHWVCSHSCKSGRQRKVQVVNLQKITLWGQDSNRAVVLLFSVTS